MADLFPAVNTDTNLKTTLENWGTKLENLRENTPFFNFPASTNVASGQIGFYISVQYFYGNRGSGAWIPLNI